MFPLTLNNKTKTNKTKRFYFLTIPLLAFPLLLPPSPHLFPSPFPSLLSPSPSLSPLRLFPVGCYLLSSGDCWDNTAPVVKSELSALIWKGHELSGRVRIVAVVIRSLSKSNADCSSAPHLHSVSFRVRLNNGWAKWENPWMNLQ